MTPWLAPRTLVVATHRPALLQWVDRIVVVDGGRIVRDGPKDDVLVRPARSGPARAKAGTGQPA